MNRHAYMIMAHNQFETLAVLLELLDDSRNDIYLHVDVKAVDFDANRLRHRLRRASLHLVERRDVRWGGYSEIECELALLRAAVQTPHAYYHLLSGVDLPIKSQDHIHQFFAANEGSEYLAFSPREEWPSTFFRVQAWHPLQERWMKGGFMVRLAARLMTRAQRQAGVNRLRKNPIELGFGSQWFSISHDLASYAVDNEPWVREIFRSSLCASEMVMQTLALRSPVRDRVVGTNLRLVDFGRGGGFVHPHVWRIADLPEILASDALFARKFDDQVDAQVIDALAAELRPSG